MIFIIKGFFSFSVVLFTYRKRKKSSRLINFQTLTLMTSITL
ncbi:Uncharacterised protein [Citrobacter werkmanii]|nr:Uncharacterised protein [Citrobacter werkmanii]